MDNFKADDIILVTGASVCIEGVKQTHRMLAKTLAVGKEDLFAVSVTPTYARPFIVSKQRCVKINDHVENPVANMILPKIGDLVLSLTISLSKTEQKVGILKEINDMPWQSKMASLMIADKYETVPYDSLIVIEK